MHYIFNKCSPHSNWFESFENCIFRKLSIVDSDYNWQTCRGVFETDNKLILTGLSIYRTLLFVQQHFIFFVTNKNINCSRRIKPFIHSAHFLGITVSGALYTGLKLFHTLSRHFHTERNLASFKREIYECYVFVSS